MEIADITLLLEELERSSIPNQAHAVQAKYWGDGKTKPWIVYANDGNQYIVKVQNNPQDNRARQLAPNLPLKILTAELVCGRIGQLFTAPMCPLVSIVNIPSELALTFVWPDTTTSIAAGPSFGSKVVDGVADAKSSGRIQIVPSEAAARLVVFQSWLYGDDPSALISPDGKLVLSVDHGYFFTGRAWSNPLFPVLRSNCRSERLCVLSANWLFDFWNDHNSFREALDELMGFKEEEIVSQFAGIPCEWGTTCEFTANLAYFALARRETVKASIRRQWQ